MNFNFEQYWTTNGVYTDPPIMGLAFKECAQKAVNAVLQALDKEKTEPTLEDEIQGFLLFLERQGPRKAAALFAHQARAVEGLTKNNQELGIAYREALAKQ